MTTFKSTLSILAAIALVGMASLAFAHGPGYGRYGNMMDDDGGYGHMMNNGGGWGHHMMGYDNDGYGNFSREDAAKLDRARDEFYESTKALGSEIRDKQIALEDAMGKDNPDPAVLSNLQKEISKLEGQFDQKALAYRLKVQKIQPEREYRRGGYGSGPCWR